MKKLNPHNEFHPHRPVRVPTAAEARVTLARDLSRSLWGVDAAKVTKVMHLPLMDVALDGQDGIAIAESRDWRQAA